MGNDINNITKADLIEFFQFIEKKQKKDKVTSFSSWHSKPYSDHTETVKFIYENNKRFVYNEQEYQIEWHPARAGRGGQDEGSPETFNISMVTKANLFDADSYLNKKVCRVADYRGGAERVKKIGYEVDIEYPIEDMLKIVGKCYETGFNVMILRQATTGDVIIYIDNHKFQQR